MGPDELVGEDLGDNPADQHDEKRLQRPPGRRVLQIAGEDVPKFPEHARGSGKGGGGAMLDPDRLAEAVDAVGKRARHLGYPIAREAARARRSLPATRPVRSDAASRSADTPAPDAGRAIARPRTGCPALQVEQTTAPGRSRSRPPTGRVQPTTGTIPRFSNRNRARR